MLESFRRSTLAACVFNRILNLLLQVMRTGTNQRPLTPGQGQQSQQESLAAAAAANPALAYTGMPG